MLYFAVRERISGGLELQSKVHIRRTSSMCSRFIGSSHALNVTEGR